MGAKTDFATQQKRAVNYQRSGTLRFIGTKIVTNKLALHVAFASVDHSDSTTDAGQNFLRNGTVITQYLAGLKPELKLVPANRTFERYQLQEVLSFLSTGVHKGFR